MIRITIIGLGLIGGSLGLALKKFGGKEWQITGYSRRQETLKQALKQGAIDQAGINAQEAVGIADLVVLATPIGAIPGILAAIAPHLKKGCVVTDTASTKEQVLKWAGSSLPAGAPFIGGHPMAGKETWGFAAAEPGLFEGATYCLVPSSSTTPHATELVTGMVKTILARPLVISADEHDRLVAGISHLPLVLSVTLAAITQKDPSWPQMAELAAGGYRDTTRLASGSPQMGRDICLTNKQALMAWIDRFISELTQFKEKIDKGDSKEIEFILSRAKDSRDLWYRQRFSNGGKTGKAN